MHDSETGGQIHLTRYGTEGSLLFGSPVFQYSKTAFKTQLKNWKDENGLDQCHPQCMASNSLQGLIQR